MLGAASEEVDFLNVVMLMLSGYKFCRYKSMPVAIKMIQPNKASAVSPDRREKFQREVTILSRVKHENIVKVFVFGFFTSSIHMYISFFF